MVLLGLIGPLQQVLLHGSELEQAREDPHRCRAAVLSSLSQDQRVREWGAWVDEYNILCLRL